MQYEFEKLKQAVVFNTVEILPNGETLDQELRYLVDQANQSGEPIRHYIGFEISGRVHVGTGIASALKIKKLQDAGVRCSIWLADYHTFLNNKLDGKLDTIRTVARGYFAPVMLACMKAVGCVVDFDGNGNIVNNKIYPVEILFAENLYKEDRAGHSFFEFDMQVAKHLTLSRVLKSVSIMGKEAGNEVEFGTLRYPVMQVADAFFMQTHLVHAGMDQRKCHVLMREVACKVDESYSLRLGKTGHIKPIAIHHHLLLGLEKPAVGKDVKTVEFVKEGKVDYEATITSTVGLETVSENGLEAEKLVGHTKVPSKPNYPIPADVIKQTQDEATNRFFEMSKMSKSKPNSAIFVDNTADEIRQKLKLAYCPMPNPELQTPEQIQLEQKWNPILDWCQNMIFASGRELQVLRPDKFGGNKLYSNYDQMKVDFLAGSLHPMDLKNAVAECLITWFEPIRNYVEKNPAGLELLKKLGK